MDAAEIRRRLADPFPASVVGWKAQAVKNNRALAVCFIDARDVMDRLDDVFGVDGWQDSYDVLPEGSAVCRLAVRIGSEWVTKTDVGSPSEQPDSGDRMKAAYSDALKRAAVKFGIGRYLYSLPAIWTDYDSVKKQFSQTPSLPAWALPGGSGRPTATSPVTQPKPTPPKTAAPSLPSDGRELHNRLRDYDAKLAGKRLCTVGALLNHVAMRGAEAGYGTDIAAWSGPAIPFAVDAVKQFEAGLQQPA